MKMNMTEEMDDPEDNLHPPLLGLREGEMNGLNQRGLEKNRDHLGRRLFQCQRDVGVVSPANEDSPTDLLMMKTI